MINQPWNLHRGSHTKEYAVSGEEQAICMKNEVSPDNSREETGGNPEALVSNQAIYNSIPSPTPHQKNVYHHQLSLTKGTAILDMIVVGLSL